MIEWPDDYRRLQESGLLKRLTDPDDPLCIWDVEFLTDKQIYSFERLSDQRVEIYPFAITGGGDFWAYLADSLPESDIVLCYRDSYEAEYVAESLTDFVFKRTVEFAGFEELGESTGWTPETARQTILLICSSFSVFLTSEMLEELRSIANALSVYSENEWTTLISESRAKEIIDRFTPMQKKDLLFEWRE